jgi:hypothetical protein
MILIASIWTFSKILIYHWPIWKDKKSYVPDKLRWEDAEEEVEEEAEEEEEAEAEEKIRLKQYVSLRSKGRHN